MSRPKESRPAGAPTDDEPAEAAATAADAPAIDESAARPATSAGHKRLRLGVFVAVVLGLQAGPIAIQVLDLDVPLHEWHMFQGKGRDICDVRFTEHTADGRELVLTVEQVTRATGARGPGLQAFRLNDVTEIRALASRYCAQASGSELHAVARCGDRAKGWRRVLKGSEDLCQPSE